MMGMTYLRSCDMDTYSETDRRVLALLLHVCCSVSFSQDRTVLALRSSKSDYTTYARIPAYPYKDSIIDFLNDKLFDVAMSFDGKVKFIVLSPCYSTIQKEEIDELMENLNEKDFIKKICNHILSALAKNSLLSDDLNVFPVTYFNPRRKLKLHSSAIRKQIFEDVCGERIDKAQKCHVFDISETEEDMKQFIKLMENYSLSNLKYANPRMYADSFLSLQPMPMIELKNSLERLSEHKPHNHPFDPILSTNIKAMQKDFIYELFELKEPKTIFSNDIQSSIDDFNTLNTVQKIINKILFSEPLDDNESKMAKFINDAQSSFKSIGYDYGWLNNICFSLYSALEDLQNE